MDYSPEIAILQSALCLLQKQVGGEKLMTLNKKDCSHVTDVVGVAVFEILDGLECDLTNIEKRHWRFKIHSFFLLKTMNTHYLESKGEITGPSLISHDLPVFSKACYFELVKHFAWQDLFMETVQWLDAGVAAELLYDLFSHVRSDPVDEHDMQIAAALLDCLCRWLLSIQYTTLISPLTQHRDKKFKPEMCLNNLANFDCCFFKSLISFLGRKNENQPQHKSGFSHVQTFLQVVLIGLACFGDQTDLQHWIYLNCYSSIADTEGEVSSSNLQLQVPDLNIDVSELLCQQVSINDWITCVSRYLNDNSIHQALLQTDMHGTSMSLGDIHANNVSLGDMHANNVSLGDVHESEVSLGFGEKRQTCCSVVIVDQISCEGIMVVWRLQKLMAGIDSLTSQLTEQEITELENVQHVLNSVLVECPVTSLEFSVDAVLWQIKNRLAGCDECLEMLLSCRAVAVWSDNRLMSVLKNNVDLLANDDTLETIMMVIKWMKTLDSFKHCWQMQQISLDAIRLLPPASQDRLIVRLYLQRCHTDMSDHLFTDESNIVPQVTAVFNKITSDNWISIVPDTCQLLVMDPVMTISKAVDMFARNVGQGPLLVKILQVLPSICRVKHPTFHPQASLLSTSICDFTVRNQLTTVEERNFINTIAVAIQAFNRKDDDTDEAILSVREMLASIILPFINLKKLGTDNSARTSFALQCLSMVLTLENNCKLQCDWIKELQPISCLVCLSEILHQCVVIWNDVSCDHILRLQLKELVLKCLILLTDKIKDSSHLFSNMCVKWLYRCVSDLDWTIPLYLHTLLFTSPQKLDDFAKSVLHSQAKDCDTKGHILSLINLLRFGAASDVTMTSMTTAMSNSSPVVYYPTLVLDLVQLLPNLVMEEWKRVIWMVERLVEQGMDVPLRLQSTKPRPGFHDYIVALSISQLLLDVTIVVQQCNQLEHVVWSHFTKSYITTIKDVVESMNQPVVTIDQSTKHMENGDASTKSMDNDDSSAKNREIFVLSQIFCHACDAAMIVPEAARETVVLLLYHLVNLYAELCTGNEEDQKPYHKILSDGVNMLEYNDKQSLLKKLEMTNRAFV